MRTSSSRSRALKRHVETLRPGTARGGYPSSLARSRTGRRLERRSPSDTTGKDGRLHCIRIMQASPNPTRPQVFERPPRRRAIVRGDVVTSSAIRPTPGERSIDEIPAGGPRRAPRDLNSPTAYDRPRKECTCTIAPRVLPTRYGRPCSCRIAPDHSCGSQQQSLARHFASEFWLKSRVDDTS
jgi:hypothetical protein